MSHSPGLLSTLGKRVDIFLNPKRVASVGRNRVAIELAIRFRDPGLPQRQPWALRCNRFAVKQSELLRPRDFLNC